MNHLETVLTARLHDLADEMTPIVDPRRQVADARARNHRQRRGRVALLAVATATAAVVVGSAVAVDLLSADRSGEVATPTVTTPATTAPAVPPTTPGEPAERTNEASSLPAGWEPRSFLGVSFAVPPGARVPDVGNEAPPIESDGGPGFGWAGPELDDWAFESVSVTTDARPAGAFLAPEGAEPVTVPGAPMAWLRTDTITVFNPSDSSDTFELTRWVLTVATEHRRVRVTAEFAADSEGEQKAQDVIAPDNGLVGALTVKAADWLGSGPGDFSCLNGREFPLDVSAFCVGPASASQVLAAADGPYELHPNGNPFRTVGFAEFIAAVEAEAGIPEGPTMGWLTIQGGVVVAFEDVTEQVA